MPIDQVWTLWTENREDTVPRNIRELLRRDGINAGQLKVTDNDNIGYWKSLISAHKVEL